jgi:hypothetical protein
MGRALSQVFDSPLRSSGAMPIKQPDARENQDSEAADLEAIVRQGPPDGGSGNLNSLQQHAKDVPRASA